MSLSLLKKFVQGGMPVLKEPATKAKGTSSLQTWYHACGCSVATLIRGRYSVKKQGTLLGNAVCCAYILGNRKPNTPCMVALA